MDVATEEGLRLNHDIIKILRDSEYPYTKLYNFLKLHFQHDCYQVKGRIKSPSSFAEKVLDKRKQKGNEKYSYDSVEDVLGFRLVVLTPAEIPQIFGKLLMALSKEDRVSSTSFEITIKDIIYYQKTVSNDLANKIEKEFLNSSYKRSTNFKIKGRIKKSGYSSLHLTIDCKTDRFTEVDKVPIEIQIRTAFEDVWGEIEHSAVYKYKEGDIDLSPSEIRRMDTLQSGLMALKNYVDSADNQVDRLINEAGHYSRKPYNEVSIHDISSASVLQNALAKIGIKDSFAHYIDALNVRDDMKERQHGELTTEFDEGWRTALRKLEKSTDILDGLYEDIKLSGGNETNIDADNGFYRSAKRLVRLEIAYNRFKSGQIHEANGGETKANEALNSAANIFSEYMKEMEREIVPRDPLVPLRFAQTKFELREYGEAELWAKAAVEWLGVGQMYKDDKNHFIHAEARRFYGLVFWMRGKAHTRLYELDKSRPIDKKLQSTQFASAFEHTHSIIDQKVLIKQVDGSIVDETKKYRERAINNLICYAIDLCIVSGGKAKLRRLIEGQYPSIREMLLQYLEALGADSQTGIGVIDNLGRVETICSAYLLVCKFEREDNDGVIDVELLNLLKCSIFTSVYLMSGKYKTEPIGMLDGLTSIQRVESLIKELQAYKMQGMDQDTYSNTKKALRFLRNNVDKNPER